MEEEMEPVTTGIGTGLALGAWAVVKSTAEQAVKDAYTTLKTLLKRKYAKVNVEQLEEDPSSKNHRAVVEADLAQTGADRDEELLRAAKTLLDTIQRQAPETASAIGVDLEDIRGASLTIENIIATGTGVKAKKVDTSGDITIKRVQAGVRGEPVPNA
jgi:hypothetical protein